MKQFIAKIFRCQVLLCSFLLLVSCIAKPAFIVGNNRYLTKIEEQDHKSCLALKINFNSNANLENQQYWQCRLSLAKYKILNKCLLLPTIVVNKVIRFNYQLKLSG